MSNIFANLAGRRKKAQAEDDKEKMEDEEDVNASEESEEEAEEEETPKAEDEKDAEDEKEAEEDKKASADYKRGAADQKKRISAILASEEANGKGDSALHIALKTNLSVADAKGVLAGVSANASQSKLNEAMKNTNTKVGVDGGRSDPAANNHGWDAVHAKVQQRFRPKK